MSDGIKGEGAVLYYGTAAASMTTVTSCTTIGNINSIQGPDENRTMIDISTMESAGYKEFIPGQIDTGEITAEINYDGSASGTANFLNTLKSNTATTQFFGIQFNDHTTANSCSRFYSQGYISNVGRSMSSPDDKVTQSVTIKLTGSGTYTDLA